MLIATCRLFTGKPVSRGYVLDTETERVVWACPHRHKSRLASGGKNSQFYAMQCAEKALAAILAGKIKV